MVGAEKIQHPPIEVDCKTMQVGSTMAAISIHLSGGLRAVQVGGEWVVQTSVRDDAAPPMSRHALDNFAASAGVRVVGGEEVSELDSPLPARFWTPFYGRRLN